MPRRCHAIRYFCSMPRLIDTPRAAHALLSYALLLLSAMLRASALRHNIEYASGARAMPRERICVAARAAVPRYAAMMLRCF